MTAALYAATVLFWGFSWYAMAVQASFAPPFAAVFHRIALAAVIFGKWRPWPCLAACLLFGFFTALETRMQGVSVPGLGVLPTQLFAALPYVLTVVLLVGVVGRAVAPKALGRPYVKER